MQDSLPDSTPLLVSRGVEWSILGWCTAFHRAVAKDCVMLCKPVVIDVLIQSLECRVLLYCNTLSKAGRLKYCSSTKALILHTEQDQSLQTGGLESGLDYYSIHIPLVDWNPDSMSLRCK